jgi:hypothetical protein
METTVDAIPRIRGVNERATLFRITSNAMINACADFLDIAQSQGGKWQRLLQHEHDQRMRLEEMVETLAKQHSSLERQARKNASTQQTVVSGRKPSTVDAVDSAEEVREVAGVAIVVKDDTNVVNDVAVDFNHAAASNVSEDDDDEFFDVLEEAEEFNVALGSGPSAHQRTSSTLSATSISGATGTDLTNDDVSSTESDAEDGKPSSGRVVTVRTKAKKPAPSLSSSPIPLQSSDQAVVPVEPSKSPVRKRRTSIPQKPNYPLNLWSIMKNCIGKELSKIPMPVNFSEPLSMLQRLTEDMEYSEILDQVSPMIRQTLNG